MDFIKAAFKNRKNEDRARKQEEQQLTQPGQDG